MGVRLPAKHRTTEGAASNLRILKLIPKDWLRATEYKESCQSYLPQGDIAATSTLRSLSKPYGGRHGLH